MTARAVGPWLLLVCCALLAPAPLAAALTAEHQKQIAEIRKELAKVQGLITKKETDEAEKLLDDCEKKLKAIAKEAGVEETQNPIGGLLKQIEQRQATLSKKAADGKGAAGGSFEKDVAPILVARCIGCHGANNPRANLRLNTFAGILAGCGGQLVVPGRPQSSMLIAKITAEGDERMPRNGDPLSADEIRKITAWIAGGAKFTGNNAMSLAEVAKTDEQKKVDAEPLAINKPTGGERVSFVRDIAPFMVNVCLDCHSGNGQGVQRTGFSLETFERLMRGGRGGRVVKAGNLNESRLWQLAGEQEPIKMPPGNALITRKNHSNLRTWIEEGAKFDGTPAQARAPLRSLVPTEEEIRAKELAALSPAELAQRRKESATNLWQAAFRKEQPTVHETDEFVLLGNVGESRLKQFAEWADEDAKALKKLFSIKDAQIWRGKLAVFLFNDRFSYAEFVQTNERVEVPAEVHGHARVGVDQGYVGLEDRGDEVSDESPGAKALLLSLLTEGLLQRSPRKVPDWAARGLGFALAARGDPKNTYFRKLGGVAHEAVASLQKPDDLFSGQGISPADVGPVGYMLVTFMMKQGGGEARFVQFVGQLAAGKNMAEALRTVYGTDPGSLATSYVSSLASFKPAAKKSSKGK